MKQHAFIIIWRKEQTVKFPLTKPALNILKHSGNVQKSSIECFMPP